MRYLMGLFFSIFPALFLEAVEIVDFRLDPLWFGFDSEMGEQYLVESSDDLTDWVTVGQLEGNGERIWFKGRDVLDEARFYRVVVVDAGFAGGLLDREWRLVSIHEKSGVIRPRLGAIHSIRLRPDSRLEGLNNCNAISGSYSLSGGSRLEISNLSTTLAGCSPESVDHLFLSELQKIAGGMGFEVRGRRLTLFPGEWVRFFGTAPVEKFEFRAVN